MRRSIVLKTSFLLMIVVCAFCASQLMGDEMEAVKQALAKREDKKAYDLLLPMAKNGNAKAQYEIGLIKWRKFSEVKQDFKEAFEWFTKAAENGNAEAMIMISMMYESGDGVARDKKESWLWLVKSAKNGNSNALYDLGIRFLKGTDSNKYKDIDMKKAITFFTKAAEKGHPESQLELGNIYLGGKNNVQEDLEKAYRYFSMGANRKWSCQCICMANLARVLVLSSTEKENLVKAYMWFLLARERKMPRLDPEISAVESKLSSYEIRSIKEIVDKWQEPASFSPDLK